MKLYLDDRRQAPEGWIRVRRPEEAINLLKTGEVTHISLDHDLGENMGTGYDVLKWIEEKIVTEGFPSPNIEIHTANPAARQRMELAVRKIYQLREERQKAEENG